MEFVQALPFVASSFGCFVSETLNLLSALQSYVFSAWLISIGLKLHHLEYTVHMELFLHVVCNFTGAVEKLIMLQDTLFCLLATLVTVWQ
jgi:hypothetical protein